MIAEVRGEGLLIGLRAVVPNGDLVNALRDEKLLSVGAGDNVVRLVPPLIVGEAEVAEAVARIDRACAAIESVAADCRPTGSRRVSANGIRHFLDLIDIPSKRIARDRSRPAAA